MFRELAFLKCLFFAHTAVLSILFEVDDKNKPLKEIFKFFENVKQENDKASFKDFPVVGVLPKKKERDKFYRYYGSLTTPNCDEVVVWTIFKETLEISKEQVKELRKLMHGMEEEVRTPISNNFRDVQPLNGRQVWYVKIKKDDDDDDDK